MPPEPNPHPTPNPRPEVDGKPEGEHNKEDITASDRHENVRREGRPDSPQVTGVAPTIPEAHDPEAVPPSGEKPSGDDTADARKGNKFDGVNAPSKDA